jgi:hypothetical protein
MSCRIINDPAIRRCKFLQILARAVIANRLHAHDGDEKWLYSANNGNVPWRGDVITLSRQLLNDLFSSVR